jgi:hypothetical protein
LFIKYSNGFCAKFELMTFLALRWLTRSRWLGQWPTAARRRTLSKNGGKNRRLFGHPTKDKWFATPILFNAAVTLLSPSYRIQWPRIKIFHFLRCSTAQKPECCVYFREKLIKYDRNINFLAGRLT